MKLLKTLVKIAISLAMIWVVLNAFDVKGVYQYLRQIDSGVIAVAVICALCVVPLHALRWMIAVEASGSHMPFGTALRIVLIGHFFNQALPSSVGGDAVRIWCAYRAGLGAGDAARTVIMDRAISLVGLLLLAGAGLPWLFDIVTDQAARFAIVAVIAVGICGFLIFVSLPQLPPFMSRWRITRALVELAILARRLTFSPRYVMPILALAVAGFVIFVFIVYWLAAALHLEVGFSDCLLLVPPVLLISVIPVSIAGWGVREGAMVVAFGFINVPPGAAFAVSVLFGLVIAAASLPGALLWLTSGYTAKSLREAAELAAAEDGKTGR
ncbi:MAG: lysylphosphatidylglycerol synthase transmembrane domain-containing protein [Burkholderiales bacterium]|nr:lysylphosphatidylglycerol synthase transmembrane domain-containing protein [Burkholderiales bacterium]